MTNLATLFKILCVIESHSNPSVLGHKGEVGIVQIRPCVLMDVNHHYHTHFTRKDCLDVKISYAIFRLYLAEYGAKDALDAARLWNGGPTRRGTDKYVGKL